MTPSLESFGPPGESALEVCGVESQGLLNVSALASAKSPHGALQREQQARGREVRDASSAREAVSLKAQHRLGLHALLFERVPTLQRTRRAVVHDDRLRLE